MNDDIDIEIVTAGPWTALKMPSGAVYVIAKQFASEADMRTAQADKKAARKPYARKGGAPPPPPPPSASGASPSGGALQRRQTLLRLGRLVDSKKFVDSK
jgi:hypothetical protein